MKKFILLSAIAVSGFILSMEEEHTNVPNLPPEIHYQVIQQIINTARTRTEALRSIHNYALTQKMSLDLVQQNKKYFEKMLDQKFELYKLAFGNYNDPAIKEKALSILEAEKQLSDNTGLQRALEKAISHINDGSKVTLGGLSHYLSLVKRVIQKPFLAMSALGIVNQFKETVDSRLWVSSDYNFNYMGSVEEAINNIKKDPTESGHFQIFDALIKIGYKLIGKEFLLQNKGISYCKKTYTIFEYAKYKGIPEVIDYLRKLGFDIMVDTINEQPTPQKNEQPTPQKQKKSYQIPGSTISYYYEGC